MNRKLLQVNVTANWGSTGRIAEEIGVAAINAGWESYVAYGRNPRQSRSNLVKIGSERDILWHVFQTRFFDRQGLASKSATKQFVKWIEQMKPDIVHLHNIHGYYVNYPILFTCLKELKTPVVWTLHDCWPFTGHCSHFMSINCMKWTTQCEHCELKRKYPGSLLFDRSYKNYIDKKKYFTSLSDVTLVPVSKWLNGLLDKSFLKCYETYTIHNGTDINVFRPEINETIYDLYHIDNKNFVIGVASVWDKYKGLDDFFKLRDALPNNLSMVLVGLTEKQMCSLPKGIIGIMRTENVEQLRNLYSMADAFVNPTYEDNFPTTNIEALACGTPVITYDTGGSPEAVDKSTGFVVDKGDIAGIVDAIRAIKERGRDYWRKACRHRAEQCFNKDRQYEQYIELYDRILSRK